MVWISPFFGLVSKHKPPPLPGLPAGSVETLGISSDSPVSLSFVFWLKSLADASPFPLTMCSGTWNWAAVQNGAGDQLCILCLRGRTDAFPACCKAVGKMNLKVRSL